MAYVYLVSLDGTSIKTKPKMVRYKVNALLQLYLSPCNTLF